MPGLLPIHHRPSRRHSLSFSLLGKPRRTANAARAATEAVSQAAARLLGTFRILFSINDAHRVGTASISFIQLNAVRRPHCGRNS